MQLSSTQDSFFFKKNARYRYRVEQEQCVTPRAFDRLRRLWSGWRGHCVSAYFSRHVSGVGTSKSGVDRVDGVYLSMSSEHHSRDEKGTTRSPAGPSKLKVSWFGKVRPCLLLLVNVSVVLHILYTAPHRLVIFFI